MSKSTRKVTAIDLFCGAGGLTHGLMQAGISVRAGFDIDENCKYIFENNNKISFIKQDITKTSKKQVQQLLGDSGIRLIAGCAPCQPFSKYTQGQDARQSNKWPMLYEFSRLIKSTKPELVTMENVPQVAKYKVYRDFKKSLEAQGYFVSSSIVFAPNYGIPQTRSRLVLFASKLGDISIIPPTHTPDEYKSVFETIAHLNVIEAGTQCSIDSLHKASSLSTLNLKRIKASKPDGSWQDWKSSLIAECHKKPGRHTYRSVYGRMSWDKPSPTITTQFTGFGNGRFGHPEQNRAITLREGALLQTFPTNYKFTSSKDQITVKHVARMIGNAVPVELGRVIGLSIMQHVRAL